MAWRAAAVSSVVTLERLGKSSPWAELVSSTAGALMAAKSERKQSRLPPRKRKPLGLYSRATVAAKATSLASSSR